MANTITLAQKYTNLLDKKYQVESKTSLLDINQSLIREGLNAKTIYIPKITMDKLANYDRENGFVKGSANLEFVAHTFTQDRGRTFSIDDMDNKESMNILFLNLAGEFIRTAVAPEVDAYRFAKYSSKAGTDVEANLTASTLLTAIDNAVAILDEKQVPQEQRFLFLNPQIYKFLKQSDKFVRDIQVDKATGRVSRDIAYLDDMQIVKVPQVRFYTEITMYDGTTAGQEVGGFIKGATGKNINFMIVHKDAVANVPKHSKTRVFDPSINQVADAWKYDYRFYHDSFVPDNKTDGIYLHNAIA